MSGHDDAQTSAPGIVLTDPAPLPRDRRRDLCPRCGAGKDKRVDAAGFGATAVWVCTACGFECAREAR